MIIKRGKKGLSPVIATALLVVLVIIIAMIIFLWIKSFVGEAVVKNGASADQRCGEINLEASRVFSALYLNNRGNVPVYSIEVKLGSAGREEVIRKDAINLAPGQADTYEIPGMESALTVNIVPSVLGETKAAKKEYTCTKIKVEVEGE